MWSDEHEIAVEASAEPVDALRFRARVLHVLGVVAGYNELVGWLRVPAPLDSRFLEARFRFPLVGRRSLLSIPLCAPHNPNEEDYNV